MSYEGAELEITVHSLTPVEGRPGWFTAVSDEFPDRQFLLQLQPTANPEGAHDA